MTTPEPFFLFHFLLISRASNFRVQTGLAFHRYAQCALSEKVHPTSYGVVCDCDPPANATRGRPSRVPATAPSNYPHSRPFDAVVYLITRKPLSKVQWIGMWL